MTPRTTSTCNQLKGGRRECTPPGSAETPRRRKMYRAVGGSRPPEKTGPRTAASQLYKSGLNPPMTYVLRCPAVAADCRRDDYANAGPSVAASQLFVSRPTPRRLRLSASFCRTDLRRNLLLRSIFCCTSTARGPSSSWRTEPPPSTSLPVIPLVFLCKPARHNLSRQDHEGTDIKILTLFTKKLSDV